MATKWDPVFDEEPVGDEPDPGENVRPERFQQPVSGIRFPDDPDGERVVTEGDAE